MRTIKLIFTLLLLGTPCWGQIGGGQTNVGGGALVQTFAGVPTGTCGKAALAVNTTNGNLYTCLNGTWTLVSGGGGSGTVSSGTVNTLAKYTGTTTVGNSLLDDGGTTANTLTYTGTGGISSTPSGGVGGTVTLPEGTTASASAGKDVMYGDSTSHCVKLSLNNGTFSCIATAGNAAVASTTAVTSSNPTINTDQQLIELSLTAGYLNTLSQPFLIHGGGVYSSTTASSPALTFKIKLCTVSGCGSGTVVTLVNIVTTTLNTTALTNATWSLGATAVTNATGATGNLVVKGVPGLVLDLGASVTTADSVFADTNTATSSNIDLTAALFVDFTVAQSVVGASNSYKQMVGMVGPVAGTGPQGPVGPSGGVSLTPATTAANTIAPTANSVVGLTVLGTTGTGSPNILNVCTNSAGVCGTTYLSINSAGATILNGTLDAQSVIVDSGSSGTSLLYFGALGDHIANLAGQTNDIYGTVTVSSSTTGTHSFTTTFTNAPQCQLTAQSDPTAVGVFWATATTTVLTAHVKISGTISFNYWCPGS